MIWRTNLENAWRSKDDLKNWFGKRMKLKTIWKTREPDPKEEEEWSRKREGKRSAEELKYCKLEFYVDSTWIIFVC